MRKDEPIEDRMCRGVRRAKALCMVLIVFEAVGIAASVMQMIKGDIGTSVIAIIALLLIRWLFDALESIISLLCPEEVETMRFPEAAFPSSNTQTARRREAHSSSPVFRDPDADVHDPIVPEDVPGDMEAARKMSANLNRR